MPEIKSHYQKKKKKKKKKKAKNLANFLCLSVLTVLAQNDVKKITIKIYIVTATLSEEKGKEKINSNKLIKRKRDIPLKFEFFDCLFLSFKNFGRSCDITGMNK